MNSQAAAVFCGSLFIVSIVLVRIVSLCPRTGAYIHRPCIWPHWNFTSPWISPRCLPLLRRLTALLPLLAPQWGHKYPSLPCHRLRRSCAATPENCKSKRVSLFYRSSRGLSAVADSRENVMNILIFNFQGTVLYSQKEKQAKRITPSLISSLKRKNSTTFRKIFQNIF